MQQILYAINFWIEIDPPPLAVFRKFIRFGSQTLPIAYWQGQANIGLGSVDRALLKHFYSYLEAEMEFEVESNPKLLNGDWFHLYAIGSYHGSLQPSIQTNIEVKVRQIWKKYMQFNFDHHHRHHFPQNWPLVFYGLKAILKSPKLFDPKIFISYSLFITLNLLRKDNE